MPIVLSSFLKFQPSSIIKALYLFFAYITLPAYDQSSCHLLPDKSKLYQYSCTATVSASRAVEVSQLIVVIQP